MSGARRRTTPRTGPTAAADRRLLRRATAVVALQTGVAAALVVAAVVAAVWAISLEERLAAAERKAEAALGRADLDARDRLLVDGLPASCPRAVVARVADAAPLGASRAEVCGTPVVVVVAEDDDGLRARAVRSTVEQQEETARLAQLSILVGLVGVLLAAGLGWAVATRAVRPLGDALASQRRFVADTSHELRTPVAVVMTRAQLLQRSLADPAQREELEQLVDDVRVLRDVVDDMLLAAELQHRPAVREPVDLLRLAHEVAGSLAVAADAAGCSLGVDPPGVHGPGEGVVVDGSSTALRRAVVALVDNALHHVAPGGSVRLAVERTGDRVLLRVVDDGDGLDPATAVQLGGRFHRGTPTGPESGPATGPAPRRLGLGLALVDEVVQAHGGRLHLDGRPGSGATVTLDLPASRANS